MGTFGGKKNNKKFYSTPTSTPWKSNGGPLIAIIEFEFWIL